VSRIVPIGYLTFREAAAKIEDALFSGVPDRAVVTRVRAEEGDVADRQANQEAISKLWEAVDKGKLQAVAIAGGPPQRLSPDMTKGILALRRHGDFTFLRPSNVHYEQVVAWFGRDLPNITLAFSERDLDKLIPTIRRARRRAARPSTGSKKGAGRPKAVPEVMSCIREVLEQKKWDPTESMKALTQQVNHRLPRGVSEDTVTRAFDELYEETHDRRFQRRRRSRKPLPRVLATK
jgi:hypothetical protein